MTNPSTPRTNPPPRRSRRVRRLVITLAILIGLLVAADFGAAAIFEYQVSTRARSEFNLADDPAVKVGGFSFLAQAISGEYDHVTVDANGVPVNDTLRDVGVHVDLYGVTAPLSELLSGSTKGVQIREVEGQVRVNASDVNRAFSENQNEVLRTITNLTIDPVDERLVADPDAEVPKQPDPAEQERDRTTAGARVCGTVDIAGQSTDICVFSVIALVDEQITVAPRRIEARNGLLTGELPGSLQARILPAAPIALDPGALPFTVTPTAVKVEPGILSLKGKAQNVVLGEGAGGGGTR
jgi:hypothetical protein